MTAQDVVRQSAVGAMSSGQGEILTGVTGSYNSRLAENIGMNAPVQLSNYVPYEVEYIVGGGGGDGAAKTFKIQVDDDKAGSKDK